MESWNTIFEGFIELAEPSDHKIYNSVDVGIGFFFDIDGFNFPFLLLFPDAE